MKQAALRPHRPQASGQPTFPHLLGPPPHFPNHTRMHLCRDCTECDVLHAVFHHGSVDLLVPLLAGRQRQGAVPLAPHRQGQQAAGAGEEHGTAHRAVRRRVDVAGAAEHCAHSLRGPRHRRAGGACARGKGKGDERRCAQLGPHRRGAGEGGEPEACREGRGRVGP